MFIGLNEETLQQHFIIPLEVVIYMTVYKYAHGMQEKKLTLINPVLWDSFKTSIDFKPARSWSPRTQQKYVAQLLIYEVFNL